MPLQETILFGCDERPWNVNESVNFLPPILMKEDEFDVKFFFSDEIISVRRSV